MDADSKSEMSRKNNNTIYYMRKIKLANDDDILKHLDNLSLPELSKTRGG